MAEESTESRTAVQNNTEAAAASEESGSNQESSTQTETGGRGQSATEQSAKDTLSSEPGLESPGAESEAEGKKKEGEGEQKAELEYADFNLPEGMDVNKDILDKFTPMAKELGLTQENAQKVVDLAGELVQSTIDAQSEAMNEEARAWKEQAKNDKTIGGAKFEENLALANKAIENLGTPEFVGFLKESQLGNHPEMIKIFHKIGTLISGDRLVLGDHMKQPEDFAKRHYPNSPQLKNG